MTAGQGLNDELSPERMHLSRIRVPLFEGVERLDWDDLAATSVITERLIRGFAADKTLFRAVLLAVEHDPYLWSKCEEDVVEDKIVLWDDVDKGLRLRLRIATAVQQQMAHYHRFSFTNLVLRGRYLHRNYETEGQFDESTRPEDVRPVIIHEDRPDDCFTIHHEALHSTPFAEIGTVSLVLRGNPVKHRALVMFREARGGVMGSRWSSNLPSSPDIEPVRAEVGRKFWRIGEEQEGTARREARQMRGETFRAWCRKLEEFGII